MISNTTKILHIEDEKWFHTLVKGALPNDDLTWVDSIAKALPLLKEQVFDLILLDRSLSGTDSFKSIQKLVELAPQTTLLVLSSDADGNAIQEALALGAHDYLIKSQSIGEELALRIQVAKKARDSAKILDQQLTAIRNSSKMIGNSTHTFALQEKVLKLAGLDINILITGESGTGKEVLATEIHRLRGDKLRPFVAINCGAISETVFESELFGHVKGAFTGADTHREGLIRVADGGDLFLDEVGELPLSQQVKLLRFIQEGTFTPVGSTKEQTAQVRIIAATNRNLEEEVKKGTFREDLFYRLDVYRIHTKPLRERPEDIGPLADFFTEEYASPGKRINKEAKKILEKQHWKGNVRELSAVIQRALVEAGEDDIRANHIRIQNIDGQPLGLALPKTKSAVSHSSFENFVNTAIRSYLESALELYEDDTLELASALEMSRATVYNKMNKLKMRTKTQ